MVALAHLVQTKPGRKKSESPRHPGDLKVVSLTDAMRESAGAARSDALASRSACKPRASSRFGPSHGRLKAG